MQEPEESISIFEPLLLLRSGRFLRLFYFGIFIWIIRLGDICKRNKKQIQATFLRLVESYFIRVGEMCLFNFFVDYRMLQFAFSARVQPTRRKPPRFWDVCIAMYMASRRRLPCVDVGGLKPRSDTSFLLVTHEAARKRKTRTEKVRIEMYMS